MVRIAFTQLLLLLLTTTVVTAQTEMTGWQYTPSEWKQLVRHCPDSFLLTAEARRIAENVLAWQRNTGGWPKNQPMHSPMNDSLKRVVMADKARLDDSTIDNDATTLEMMYMARMYRAMGDERYRRSLMQGIEYLLNGQYENGGWPQFWPQNKGYQVHITYNDNAMVQTIRLIRSLRDGEAPFTVPVDSTLRRRLARAFDLGIECILNTQIRVDGKPTVWCQQHDHVTLLPAGARAYELPSFCSSESVGIVELLMEIPNPSERVRQAIEGAISWFEEHQLRGIRLETFVNEEGQKDKRVVEDSTATPLWARFYDLESGKPFFCDRDGIPRQHLEDIGYERRNGYAWYISTPARLRSKMKEKR